MRFQATPSQVLSTFFINYGKSASLVLLILCVTLNEGHGSKRGIEGSFAGKSVHLRICMQTEQVRGIFGKKGP